MAWGKTGTTGNLVQWRDDATNQNVLLPPGELPNQDLKQSGLTNPKAVPRTFDSDLGEGAVREKRLREGYTIRRNDQKIKISATGKQILPSRVTSREQKLRNATQQTRSVTTSLLNVAPGSAMKETYTTSSQFRNSLLGRQTAQGTRPSNGLQFSTTLNAEVNGRDYDYKTPKKIPEGSTEGYKDLTAGGTVLRSQYPYEVELSKYENTQYNEYLKGNIEYAKYKSNVNKKFKNIGKDLKPAPKLKTLDSKFIYAGDQAIQRSYKETSPVIKGLQVGYGKGLKFTGGAIKGSKNVYTFAKEHPFLTAGTVALATVPIAGSGALGIGLSVVRGTYLAGVGGAYGYSTIKRIQSTPQLQKPQALGQTVGELGTTYLTFKAIKYTAKGTTKTIGNINKKYRAYKFDKNIVKPFYEKTTDYSLEFSKGKETFTPIQEYHVSVKPGSNKVTTSQYAEAKPKGELLFHTKTGAIAGRQTHLIGKSDPYSEAQAGFIGDAVSSKRIPSLTEGLLVKYYRRPLSPKVSQQVHGLGFKTAFKGKQLTLMDTKVIKKTYKPTFVIEFGKSFFRSKKGSVPLSRSEGIFKNQFDNPFTGSKYYNYKGSSSTPKTSPPKSILEGRQRNNIFLPLALSNTYSNKTLFSNIQQPKLRGEFIPGIKSYSSLRPIQTPRSGQRSYQDYFIPQISLTTGGGGSFPNITPNITPPGKTPTKTPPPKPPPGIITPFKSFGLKKRKESKGTTGGYFLDWTARKTPSIRAKLFNIRGVFPRIVTGLEVRPLPILK